MYESERGRVLHWVYTVLSSGKMSTLHSSFFPQLTFRASKRRQTALNQMEQLHPKWRVPLYKGSSFTLSPSRSPHPSALWSERKTLNSQPEFVYRSDVCFCYLRADCFGFAVLSKTFSMLILRTHLSQKHKKKTDCHSACSCGNLATVNIHSQGFLKKKQTRKENKKKVNKKHFIVLYIWKYMSEYWKKMYMLTNLWQNILCKAQYLKLQYFWFLKQTRKKTYQKDSKTFALHRIRGQFKTEVTRRLLRLCGHGMKLQKLASCKTGSGHAKCVFSWTQKCIEDCRSQRKSRLWRQSSGSVTAGNCRRVPVEWNLPSCLLLWWFSHKTKLWFTPSVHASSSDISTLCRTESYSIL